MNTLARLGLAVALLAAGAPQDPEPAAEDVQKIRALILQMKDRNIGVRKKAEDDLFQLGMPALPILRLEEARLSSGELKHKVGVIIRRIERMQKASIASGNTLRVTLKVADKPVVEVLAELQKMTGVPIEAQKLPADAVTTLEAEGLSLWDAVNQICEKHGKLSWDVSEKGIVVRRENYVAPFMVTYSGYALILRSFLRYPPGPGTGDRDYLKTEAIVVGPPGAVPYSHHLTFDALVDDKNQNLLASPSGLATKPVVGEYRLVPEPDPKRPVYRPVWNALDAAPNARAAKVKTCKGTATFVAVIEMERRVEIRGQNLKKDAKDGGFGVEIEIETLETAGGKIRIDLAVTDGRIAARREQRILHPQNRGKIVLRDAKGGEIQADVDVTGRFAHPPPSGEPLPTKETTKFRIEAKVKPDVTLAGIEIWEPTTFEEIKLPFDFKDVPMKKTK